MKNEYEIREKEAIIFANRKEERKEIIIDAEDLELVDSFTKGTWFILNGRYASYKKETGKNENNVYTLMHRLIRGFPEGKDIDHINHNTL